MLGCEEEEIRVLDGNAFHPTKSKLDFAGSLAAERVEPVRAPGRDLVRAVAVGRPRNGIMAGTRKLRARADDWRRPRRTGTLPNPCAVSKPVTGLLATTIAAASGCART